MMYIDIFVVLLLIKSEKPVRVLVKEVVMKALEGCGWTRLNFDLCH